MHERPADALLDWVEALPPSLLFAHPEPCCTQAMSYFEALSRSQARPHLGSPAALAWIPRRWSWGPTAWPLAWCEAIHAPHLDCSALAALARQACLHTGRPVDTLQTILPCSGSEALHWHSTWTGARASTGWIGEAHVFHEVLAFPQEEGELWWDPTDGRLLDPDEPVGIRRPGEAWRWRKVP